MQFTGQFDGPQNAFRLSGLEVRTDLSGKRFSAIEADLGLRNEFNSFVNHTIRTVVIRNWPDLEFLHLVFLRLNTGSLKLSPQELRQAMIPGPFSEYVDEVASESTGLKAILSRKTPDPRMRDVELLVRFLCFQSYLSKYQGRIKRFLDESCQFISDNWIDLSGTVGDQCIAFELGIEALIEIFGIDGLARKPGSRSFNRAVFDALIFYAADEKIRDAMLAEPEKVREAFGATIADEVYAEAVESDTAGLPHTLQRLETWGQNLSSALNLKFNLPYLIEADGQQINRHIAFPGFW
jgi:hypothetical protein